MMARGGVAAARRATAPGHDERGARAALVVRQAVPADLPAVAAMRLALIREHASNPLYARVRPDARRRARRVFDAQLRSPTQAIFLAERHGEPVGVLRCVHCVGHPLLLPEEYAYISSVYVVPPARRQGVMRALLRAAVRWARARGLTEMRLHNAVDNPVAAASWSALGFRAAEELRVRRLD